MKIIDGAASFASLNKSRTREAPTPTNISTKSEPEMLKNGTPASPATAFAKSVLPVPGGPTRRQPRGIFAPIAWYLAGFARKSLISCISSTASSTPATSANVTSGRSSSATLALFLPKPICWLLAFCICEKKKNRSAPMIRMGSSEVSRPTNGLGSFTWYWIAGCAAISSPSASEPT